MRPAADPLPPPEERLALVAPKPALVAVVVAEQSPVAAGTALPQPALAEEAEEAVAAWGARRAQAPALAPVVAVAVAVAAAAAWDVREGAAVVGAAAEQALQPSQRIRG